MKIVMVAGGTGGHIYPALALADALSKRGNTILFIGSSNRMEKDVVPAHGFEFVGLDVDIPSGTFFSKAKSAISIDNAYNKCKELLKGFDLAIGFGNYISYPVMKAAKDLGLKTIIHEQNYFAGKANKMLDKKMDLVIGSYDANKEQFKNKNTKILGNPQASKAQQAKKDPIALLELGLNPHKKTVFIFMGSLGSQSVNKVMMDYLNQVGDDYQVVYATGKQNIEEVKKNVTPTETMKFFETVDGASLIRNSDLVVCRAGATSVAEIAAIGKAAILIPSPFVPNNHQYFNAKALVDNGAALMLEEKDLSVEKLNQMIGETIRNDSLLRSLGNGALSLSNPKVLEDILLEIEKLC